MGADDNGDDGMLAANTWQSPYKPGAPTSGSKIEGVPSSNTANSTRANSGDDDHASPTSGDRFETVDWKIRARLAQEDPVAAEALQLANKKRLLKFIGADSELNQNIENVASSTSGHITIKMDTGQEIQFLTNPKNGKLAGVSYSKNEMSKNDIKVYMAALEKDGQVANLNKIVPTGTVKYQANAYRAIKELKLDMVNDHLVAMDTSMRNDLSRRNRDVIGSEAAQAKLRDDQEVVNTVSSAVASGRLSDAEISRLYKMTVKTKPGGPQNQPDMEFMRDIAAKYPAPENDNAARPAQARPDAQQRQGGPGIRQPKVG